MPNLAEQYPLSEQQYLAGELDSPIKHEYIDGDVTEWLLQQAAQAEADAAMTHTAATDQSS